MGPVQFNPPPGWPDPPPEWLPPADWSPPRHWPEPPTGWEFFWEEPADAPARLRTRTARDQVDPGYLTPQSRLIWALAYLRTHVSFALAAAMAVTLIGLIIVTAHHPPMSAVAAACQSQARTLAENTPTDIAPEPSRTPISDAGTVRGFARGIPGYRTSRVVDAGQRSDGYLTVTIETRNPAGTADYLVTCTAAAETPQVIRDIRVVPAAEAESASLNE